ncbi:MAG: hypothetical protein IKX06_01365 [Clostridia bacterium]|nr:hypothetical protein [Clostridia bacterium]
MKSKDRLHGKDVTSVQNRKASDTGGRPSSAGVKQRFASLGRPYFAFLRMDACIMAIVSLLSLFINTFIVRASGGIDNALIYNMVTFGAQPLFMVAAVFVSRRLSPCVSQRLGFVFYGILFLFIIVTGERSATDLFVVPALLRAAGAGFYYVTYSFQIVEYTTDDNRDAASGIGGTVSSVIALILPLLAGLFLSGFHGSFSGYRIFFSALLCIATLGLIFSLRLAPLRRSVDTADRRAHLSGVLKSLTCTKTGVRVLLITFFKGLRSGALSFFVELLIFSAIKSESLIGVNAALGKTAAILAAVLYGIFVTPKRRAGSVAAASTVIIAAACVLFFKMDRITLIVFSILNAGLAIFITEPELTLYFTVISETDGLKGLAGEVHTVNEFFLAAGEVAGIGLTLFSGHFFPGSGTASVVSVIILAASQYVCALLIHILGKEGPSGKAGV